jgi:hypothetical protein
MPFPTDGPPIPIGVPTLNSQSFLPVSLSNAKIIPHCKQYNKEEMMQP